MEISMDINRIKIIRNSVASGRDVFVGEKYTVPDDISAKDARLLVMLGKAVRLKAKEPAAEQSSGANDATAASE
jgi:hypothetical protein